MSTGWFDLRYCTLLKSDTGEFVSCDTVPDDHVFGLSADGRFQHLQGVHLPDDRIVAFGMARGSMSDLYPVFEPCGHGPDVSDAL